MASKINLSVGGEIVAPIGATGEVIKVLRNDDPSQVQYHVRFPGRTLQVPENVLLPLGQEEESDDSNAEFA